jgi:bifunctional isochorismate lyase / aryl carrier protein
MTIPRIAPYTLPTEADWPESRARWLPEPGRAALLVHDLQRYFLSFYAEDAEPLASLRRNVLALLGAARARGIPVFFSAQPGDELRARRALLNDFWGPGLLARPELSGLDPALQLQPGERVLEKTRYSALVGTELLPALRDAGRDQLIVVGVFAHIGCMLTAADAFMHDVQPFLVGDAVADFSREEHDLALRYVATRCGAVIGTERLLAVLAGDAGHAHVLRSALAGILDRAPSTLDAHVHLRELGLDSVRALLLLERLEEHGIELHAAELLEHPTLSALSRHVQARLQAERASEGEYHAERHRVMDELSERAP